MKDVRAILRLSHGQGLSEREVAGRRKLSRATVSTYLLRAPEAGLSGWPLPAVYEDEAVLEQLLFRRMGRPPRDTRQPHWPTAAADLKRKGVSLILLWQEYRAAHPDGYGYTWLCDAFRALERGTHANWRNRHEGASRTVGPWAVRSGRWDPRLQVHSTPSTRSAHGRRVCSE